jgi:hypothetical protein
MAAADRLSVPASPATGPPGARRARHRRPRRHRHAGRLRAGRRVGSGRSGSTWPASRASCPPSEPCSTRDGRARPAGGPHPAGERGRPLGSPGHQARAGRPATACRTAWPGPFGRGLIRGGAGLGPDRGARAAPHRADRREAGLLRVRRDGTRSLAQGPRHPVAHPHRGHGERLRPLDAVRRRRPRLRLPGGAGRRGRGAPPTPFGRWSIWSGTRAGCSGDWPNRPRSSRRSPDWTA